MLIPRGRMSPHRQAKGRPLVRVAPHPDRLSNPGKPDLFRRHLRALSPWATVPTGGYPSLYNLRRPTLFPTDLRGRSSPQRNVERRTRDSLRRACRQFATRRWMKGVAPRLLECVYLERSTIRRTRASFERYGSDLENLEANGKPAATAGLPGQAPDALAPISANSGRTGC